MRGETSPRFLSCLYLGLIILRDQILQRLRANKKNGDERAIENIQISCTRHKTPLSANDKMPFVVLQSGRNKQAELILGEVSVVIHLRSSG